MLFKCIICIFCLQNLTFEISMTIWSANAYLVLKDSHQSVYKYKIKEKFNFDTLNGLSIIVSYHD